MHPTLISYNYLLTFYAVSDKFTIFVPPPKNN